jgi:mannose-6-phosphate isomerase-like protein (cupin superfamily)
MSTLHAPEVKNVWTSKKWFEVLQTSEKSQTAVMTLAPGKSSGEEAEAHDDSEQVLIVIEGEVVAEIADEAKRLRLGDVVVIPPGTKHKFINPGRKPAVTFNVYCPPEYSQGD